MVLLIRRKLRVGFVLNHFVHVWNVGIGPSAMSINGSVNAASFQYFYAFPSIVVSFRASVMIYCFDTTTISLASILKSGES